jgi:Lysosomal transcription factor, NCU-G1
LKKLFPKVFELLLPNGPLMRGGFMQWHRMAFTSPAKSAQSVITTHQQHLRAVDSIDMDDVLLQSYYGADFFGANTQAFNITFGYFGQNYYDNIVYLSW